MHSVILLAAIFATTVVPVFGETPTPAIATLSTCNVVCESPSLATLVTTRACADEVTSLSQLALTPMTSGWGRARADHSIDGNPLIIGGRTYASGVGTHAVSGFTLKLGGNGRRFSASVGVDDETAKKGSVCFKLFGDDKELFSSGTMKGGEPAKAVDVSLTGIKSLKLLVTDAGDGNEFDHADWADAWITMSQGKPLVVSDPSLIEAVTDHAVMAWRVEKDGTLSQRDFGTKSTTGNFWGVAYPAAGYDYVTEPALRAVHADGNASTDLVYLRHQITRPADGVTLTRIELRDRIYPLFVTLYCRSHEKIDLFEFWTEIRHEESDVVTLYNFASTAPIIPQKFNTLSHFHGIWGWGEAVLEREKLSKGTKILDSKLGSRAQAECSPMFLLTGENPQEESGEVIGGALAWSGNFQFAFEQATPRDSRSDMVLRAICGMNPFASHYRLEAGKTFTTPALILGYSDSGLGGMSRNFHKWARNNVLRDGDKPRAILLNNWEATYFNFDEKKIVGLFDGAKETGMELFLLDDGWFGDKCPRNDDTVGLGDWMPNPKKLPHGVEGLAQEALKRGLRFGIWIEPEMVNPNSELFRKHPDWALTIPGRAHKMHRNQLVLDLCNPEVEEYAFKCMNDLLTNAPGVSYVKWDCNSQMLMPYSPFLGAHNQSYLYIEYNRALQRIMERVARKHPKVQMMACSAGGARVDYGSLSSFHEFWPSDITDPIRRIQIQHNFSYFFPAMAQADHVTHMGNRPLKFSFDVAMSGRLGMDMDLQKLSPADRDACTTGIAAYKSIRDIVQLGDQFRLEDAQENGWREAIIYVSEDKSKAALMVYQTGNPKGEVSPVKLNGLDQEKLYRLKEINLAAGTGSLLPENGKAISGKTLMEQGLTPPCRTAISSAVISFTIE